MFTRFSDHGKGLLLAAFGGMLLTIDIPLVRLGEGDPFSVMLMRSMLVIAAAMLFLLFRAILSGRFTWPISGRIGWLITLLYGMSATFFLLSVYNTSTANLVFILAFNPMFAALLSWIFLGERPRRATLLAMVIMATGVLIIVHEGLGSGHLAGDLMALSASFCLATAITMTRHSRRDMSLAPMIGTLGPCLIAAFMVSQTGFRIDVPWWIVLDGLIVVPLSFFCLALAPKYISGPEVAMFYLLETVITPVWVWMIFAEAPTVQSAIGGAVLIVTLVAHSAWQLKRGRR